MRRTAIITTLAALTLAGSAQAKNLAAPTLNISSTAGTIHSVWVDPSSWNREAGKELGAMQVLVTYRVEGAWETMVRKSMFPAASGTLDTTGLAPGSYVQDLNTGYSGEDEMGGCCTGPVLLAVPVVQAGPLVVP